MTLAGCGKNWASRESEGRGHPELVQSVPAICAKRKSVEPSFRRFENSRNVEESRTHGYGQDQAGWSQIV
jgi:hypothetical protein